MVLVFILKIIYLEYAARMLDYPLICITVFVTVPLTEFFTKGHGLSPEQQGV